MTILSNSAARLICIFSGKVGTHEAMFVAIVESDEPRGKGLSVGLNQSVLKAKAGRGKMCTSKIQEGAWHSSRARQVFASKSR